MTFAFDEDEKKMLFGGNDDNSHGPSTSNSSVNRPGPNSHVQFRIARSEKERNSERMSRSDPMCTMTPVAKAPRNRRRLIRDISYNNIVTRRSTLSDDRNMRKLFANQRRTTSQGSRNLFSGRGLNMEDTGSTGSNDSRAYKSDGKRRRSKDFRGKSRTKLLGQPGGTRARFKSYFDERTRYLSRARTDRGSDETNLNSHLEPREQYRISPPEESRFSVLDVFFQLYSMAFGDVAMWVYGANFGRVLLFFLMLYMMFVYCFVVLLYLVDRYYTDSSCINAPEEGELSTRAHFEYAFELSWTTFTTVGYGNLGPPPDLGCYPIRLVCSIEAILGMAFVSMCSGLFYAKLLRLLGRAQVTFSSTLCVQYGKGLSGNEDEDVRFMRQKKGGPGANPDGTFDPFPVIEFRIVNNRANHTPGKNEIWDAEVTAIVQLSIENDPHENSEGLDEFQVNRSSRWLRPPTISKFNEGADNKNQKVFYKLALKPSFHPYFSRVWFLRHTLDATSPLLRREVRQMIRDNSSGWDPTHNNHADIRSCLVEFNSLQVIMSGESALSRSEVYAEKTYTYDDVCVGWRYVAVCYEEEHEKERIWQQCERLKRKHISFGDDAATSVDLSLIHDIAPQRGNDFEPLT
mmetsp:Transcript_26529/g.56066  ORF Transcript_26529/g.56066 Transcript_26529/m.56066 type:complete len:630 (+) Transcript_26529:146-2035(+)|eukprot:CAMPEP_0183732840 /NCGR_PEP_ID=MMETSP0737-20130205/39494_1 /TAXON_ID=385413 /ORGANISM="Thalassiosira miniscula, Strain CCMP1093" /LENGTH=629 /DNA_ID=CAMNT_0025965959 /DNA_START=56 /DNA_END=1945 /DNA_ORIENTATION=+